MDDFGRSVRGRDGWEDRRDAERFLGDLERDRNRDRDRDGPGRRDVRDVPPPPPPGHVAPARDDDDAVPAAAGPSKKRLKKLEKEAKAAAAAEEEDAAPVDDAEAEMMRMMGFGGFNSTQGKHVDDPNANVSGANKKTTRRARQYMNRPGGFNRPLPEEVTGVRSNKI